MTKNIPPAVAAITIRTTQRTLMEIGVPPSKITPLTAFRGVTEPVSPGLNQSPGENQASPHPIPNRFWAVKCVPSAWAIISLSPSYKKGLIGFTFLVSVNSESFEISSEGRRGDVKNLYIFAATRLHSSCGGGLRLSRSEVLLCAGDPRSKVHWDGQGEKVHVKLQESVAVDGEYHSRARIARPFGSLAPPS